MLGMVNPSRSPCAASAVLNEDFPRISSQNECRHWNHSILFGLKNFWETLRNSQKWSECQARGGRVLGMVNPSRAPCAAFAFLNEDFTRIFSQNDCRHWNRSILFGRKMFLETLGNSRKWSECRARGTRAENGKSLNSPLCCLCSSQ